MSRHGNSSAKVAVIIKNRKDLTLKDQIPAQIKDSARPVVLPEAAELARLMPMRHDTSRLTVTCRPSDYSASAIARAAEDCDAHLLNLNVTADTTDNGEMTVELRISTRDTRSVARSLLRYGYTVALDRSDISDDDLQVMRERVNALIHYLEI